MAYTYPEVHSTPTALQAMGPAARAKLAATTKAATKRSSRRAAQQAADLAAWHRRLEAGSTDHGPQRTLADYTRMAQEAN